MPAGLPLDVRWLHADLYQLEEPNVRPVSWLDYT